MKRTRRASSLWRRIEPAVYICSMLSVAVFAAAWAHSLAYEGVVIRVSERLETERSGLVFRHNRGVYLRQKMHGFTLAGWVYTVPDAQWRGWGTGGGDYQSHGRVGVWTDTAWWFACSLKDGHEVGWPGAPLVKFPGYELTVTVPYWTLVLAGAAGTFVCGRHRRELKRERAGHCPKCNYDRTGIAADAVCPECGKAP